MALKIGGRFLANSRKYSRRKLPEAALSRRYQGSSCSEANATNLLPDLDEFRNRRLKLAQSLARKCSGHPGEFGGSAPLRGGRSNHLVLVPAGELKYVVDKIPFPYFRSATDFRYLAGPGRRIQQSPGLILALEMAGHPEDPPSLRTTLFVDDPDEKAERWEGPKLKPDEAISLSGVDEARPFSDLANFVRTAAAADGHGQVIWYDKANPVCSRTHQVLSQFFQGGPLDVESPREAFHELRLIKSEAEIRLMRTSCQIASQAIKETMRSTPRMGSERQLLATVEYRCKMAGAPYMAYPPVVAAGNNCTVLHHHDYNDGRFDRDNDLILMDAGCEYAGYASDITRVWPASGQFRGGSAQRLVYEAVLDVQLKLIQILASGGPQPENGSPWTLDALYREMQRLFRPYLEDLGMVHRDWDEATARAVCSDVCPHHVSHYLGMDVHDTSLMSRNRPLAPGMVITVEPGLYFPKNRPIRFADQAKSSKLSKELAGIGVRIEDDVLITSKSLDQTTCEVLSDLCPKTVPEIESTMRETNAANHF